MSAPRAVAGESLSRNFENFARSSRALLVIVVALHIAVLALLGVGQVAVAAIFLAYATGLTAGAALNFHALITKGKKQ